MSYKYSKGSQVIGDLKAADDTERNTLIDFGEDQIEFQTSGSVRLQISNDHLSSSLPLSASVLHLQEGMNIGGQTIFNSQGNIVGTSAATAVITIADNPTAGDTISFGDSTITPVIVSTYQSRATGDNITLGASAAATRTNTKTKLESLHNVSITINGNDLEITNNNLGPIGNRTISETFTSANNSVSGFTGGNAIDILANEITASSFSSPNGTLISAVGDFQGNNASFNEITASSNLSFSGDLFLNNTEKLIDSQGDHALLQTMVVELSIPGTDVQTDSSAFRFFCPYNLTVNELQLNLDENNSGEAVTVQISGSQGFTQSLTLTGPTNNGTTGSLNGSLQAGELLNFEITSVTGTPQGLIANLLYRRTLP